MDSGFATLASAHMLEHVETPRVVFEPESLISHRHVLRILTSVRSNYEVTGLLDNFSKCISFVDFQFHPGSPVLM